MSLWLAILILGQPGPGGEPLPEGEIIVETADDEVYQIGQLIRCPVCQGMPIAESPSAMARNMMTKVRELHAQGKSREEILAYFEARYGEFARLDPKPRGINWLVWVMPGLAVVLAFVLIASRIRKRPPPASPEGSDSDAGAEDDYLRAVREEVSR